jgi:hypothetical protein
LVRSKKSKRKKSKLNKWWKARVGSSIKKKKNELLSYFITLMINSLYGFFYSLFLLLLSDMNEGHYLRKKNLEH